MASGDIYLGDKGELPKLSIPWETLAYSPTLVLQEARFMVTDNYVAVVGVLGDNSEICQYGKPKDFNPKGLPCHFKIATGTKDVYDKISKSYNPQPVHKNESYIYRRVVAALKAKDLSKSYQFTFVPCIQPMLWDLIGKIVEGGEPDEFSQKYLGGLVVIGENAVPAPTTTQAMLDSIAQSNSSNSGSGGKTYTPAEKEGDKLEARWQFVRSQLKSYGEYPTLGEFIVEISAYGQSDREKAEKLLTLLMGFWS